MTEEHFYRELGKYLYAVAMVDGEIQDSEKHMLDKIIDDELTLLAHDDEAFKYREVTLAKLSFYTCVREQIGIQDAKNSFLNYVSENQHRLDQHVRKIAMRLIRRMAEAWKGINKSESEILLEAQKVLGAD
jgi:hypothetical protein